MNTFYATAFEGYAEEGGSRVSTGVLPMFAWVSRRVVLWVERRQGVSV